MYTLAVMVAMRARSFRTEVLQDDARFRAFFKLSHYKLAKDLARSGSAIGATDNVIGFSPVTGRG